MPNYFLAKTEPRTYSIDQLRSDMKTIWDGVTNPQAVGFIRKMRPGDRVFIYHSGTNPGVVGLAAVLSEPYPDPANSKSTVVELSYLSHLTPPTPLPEIKANAAFEQWALVRQGRLSTMSAPAEFVEWMRNRYPGVEI
jgi:predicted RNA-binding protein with PUA-like domain